MKKFLIVLLNVIILIAICAGLFLLVSELFLDKDNCEAQEIPAAAVYADRNEAYRAQVQAEIERRHELKRLELEYRVNAQELNGQRDNVTVNQRASNFSRFASDTKFNAQVFHTST